MNHEANWLNMDMKEYAWDMSMKMTNEDAHKLSNWIACNSLLWSLHVSCRCISNKNKNKLTQSMRNWNEKLWNWKVCFGAFKQLML